MTTKERVAELEALVKSLQDQHVRERGDLEARLKKGHDMYKAEAKKAEKFKKDFEEAARWQGFWRNKANFTMRKLEKLEAMLNARGGEVASRQEERVPF